MSVDFLTFHNWMEAFSNIMLSGIENSGHLKMQLYVSVEGRVSISSMYECSVKCSM